MKCDINSCFSSLTVSSFSTSFTPFSGLPTSTAQGQKRQKHWPYVSQNSACLDCAAFSDFCSSNTLSLAQLSPFPPIEELSLFLSCCTMLHVVLILKILTHVTNYDLMICLWFAASGSLLLLLLLPACQQPTGIQHSGVLSTAVALAFYVVHRQGFCGVESRVSFSN